MKIHESLIMKKSFKIPVYIEEVRQAVRSKQNHPSYEAKWADTHLILVRVHKEDEALAQCQRRHPVRMGLVHGIVAEIY